MKAQAVAVNPEALPMHVCRICTYALIPDQKVNICARIKSDIT
jgi:hypothetical protein